MQHTQKFLGRVFNQNTRMWEFQDGSGAPVPEELRQEMFNDLMRGKGGTLQALGRLFKFKEDHAK